MTLLEMVQPFCGLAGLIFSGWALYLVTKSEWRTACQFLALALICSGTVSVFYGFGIGD